MNQHNEQEAVSIPSNDGHVQRENLQSTEGSGSNKDKYEREALESIIDRKEKQGNKRTRYFLEGLTFMKAEKKLRTQQLLENNQLYLISKPWLDDWKKMVQYDRILRSEKPQWELTEISPKSIINLDLVKKETQTLNLGKDKLLNHVFLKQFLQENVDFEYLSQQMWEVFQNYSKVEIRRDVVEDRPNHRIVELMPPKVNLIVLSNRLIREVRDRLRPNLPRQTFQFSRYKSVEFFENVVRESLIDSLVNKHSINDDEINYEKAAFKFHYIRESIPLYVILRRIRSSHHEQRSSDQFSIYTPFIDVGNCKMLSEIFCDKAVVICEILEKYEGDMYKICYNESSYSYSKCPFCLKITDLVWVCNCKNIAYCSQICQDQHKFHMKDCSFKKRKQGEQFKNMSALGGLVGIANLGNTCFMNSGLQCLSNTVQLTEYFLKGEHLIDLQLAQPSNENLTSSYHKVIQALWLPENNLKCYFPKRFKQSVSSFHSTFQGHQQNDAGQFLIYLLDGLHSELNRSTSTFCLKEKEIDRRPENVIADEQWQHFLMKNDSKITQLMYGQFKSLINCPNCKNMSVKFDPFLMCQLPIPQIEQAFEKLQIIFQDQVNFKQETMKFNCPQDYKLSQIGKRLIKRKNLPVNAQIIFFTEREELNPDRNVFYILYEMEDTIYARVLSQHENPRGCRVFVDFKSSEVGPNGLEERRFMRKLFKFFKNIKLYEVSLTLYLLHRELCDIGDSGEDLLKGGKIEIKAVPESKECFACHSSFCNGCRLPAQSMELGWILKQKKSISLEYIIRGRLSKPLRRAFQAPVELSLMDCYKAFLAPQVLSNDNAWLCPQCKNQVRAQKQMMVYRAPKILMICLKRFKHFGSNAFKNNQPIRYPIWNLDLTNVVLKKETPKFEGETELFQNPEGKILYDLYAVCCHHGTPENGHYTAICKNHNNKTWYRFDDKKVIQIKECEVLNSQAYILFYRRKEEGQ